MEPNELELEPFKPEIQLEDFQKLDFRVCQVVACEEVVKSRNFLKLTVNDGQGERIIMSTIRAYYNGQPGPPQVLRRGEPGHAHRGGQPRRG